MHTLTRTGCAALLTLIPALFLTACGGSSDRPTQLDDAARALRLTQTALVQPTSVPQATETPWPTPWPTATARPTLHPSPSPYPTRDRTGATEVPVGQLVPRGEWLTLPFTDDTGETRTLAEFVGRAVVLHTLSASCQICFEQQQHILLAAEDRHEIGLLTDTVFVALDVLPNESAARLRRALQDALGEQWAIVELILSDDVPAEYIFGAASGALRAALVNDFGPEAALPETATVIVIEPDGTAHLLYEGLVDWHDVRDAITQFSNPPPDGGQ